MENSGKLSGLLSKYFEGSCSQEELEELFAWIRLAYEDKRLHDQLHHEWEKAARESLSGNSIRPAFEPDWPRMLSRISGSTPDQVENPVLTHNRPWKWAAAAVLVFALLGTGYFIYSPPSSQQQSLLAGEKHVIQPGGNKAMLILSDGSRILLDSAANGLLARQQHTIVNKDQDGRLVYRLTDTEHITGPPEMNTVSTPRGGQYQVMLPDGTSVWLNAASSIRFPSSFTGNERRLELSGEAYFEVARDEKRPFLVSSGTQTVEVLGTHFNISAYQDDPLIKTTLIEGAVKVVEHISGRSEFLRPGQEAAIAEAGQITLTDAIPGQATAWKEGKFTFNGESIEQIMRRIARWYDVEVIFQGNVGEAYFTGSVSRFADVTDVLRKLELTGTVHFKIEERRIIVMP